MKDYRYLYGPVPSRRLGRSLGIDLVPHKICSYDCIYCQIGRTTEKTLIRKEYIPTIAILEEVTRFLKIENSGIDHISLSGSGEPTLHSGIGFLIEAIKAITPIPVAVITNSSLLYEEEVRRDLLRADAVLPSLDGVSQESFDKVNRPLSGLSVEKVIEGLVDFRKVYSGQVWLEILFCKGINDSKEELTKMKEAINQIQPDLIHLNTVVRPPSEKWTVPLGQKELEQIRAFFGRNASIISEFDRHPSTILERDAKREIMAILKRRPLSLSDLSDGLGIPEGELDRYLEPLTREGAIRVRVFGDSVFYEVNQFSD